MPDNVRKYLLYAIGEILLVVIGILLALQVNNWNEDRKKVSDEIRILAEIQKESNEAKKSREQIVETYTLLRTRIASSLDLIYAGEGDQLTSDECMGVFQSHIIRWDPINISTLEEIIASGKISVISNDELRSLLIQFRNISFSNNQSLMRTVNEANVLVDNYPDLIIRKWVQERQTSEFECNVSGMRSNPFFRNQLQSNYGRMTAPLNASQEELIVLQNILNTLETLLD